MADGSSHSCDCTGGDDLLIALGHTIECWRLFRGGARVTRQWKSSWRWHRVGWAARRMIAVARDNNCSHVVQLEPSGTIQHILGLDGARSVDLLREWLAVLDGPGAIRVGEVHGALQSRSVPGDATEVLLVEGSGTGAHSPDVLVCYPDSCYMSFGDDGQCAKVWNNPPTGRATLFPGGIAVPSLRELLIIDREERMTWPQTRDAYWLRAVAGAGTSMQLASQHGSVTAWVKPTKASQSICRPIAISHVSIDVQAGKFLAVDWAGVAAVHGLADHRPPAWFRIRDDSIEHVTLDSERVITDGPRFGLLASRSGISRPVRGLGARMRLVARHAIGADCTWLGAGPGRLVRCREVADGGLEPVAVREGVATNRLHSRVSAVGQFAAVAEDGTLRVFDGALDELASCPTVKSPIGAIAALPRGGWVTGHENGGVVAFDPSTGRRRVTSVGTGVVAIVGTLDGVLWVQSRNGVHVLSSELGKVRVFKAATAVAADGAFALFASGRVLRVARRGNLISSFDVAYEIFAVAASGGWAVVGGRRGECTALRYADL